MNAVNFPQATQDRVMLGITMMLVAYLLFAMLDTSVKWMIVQGYVALQLAFLRYAGHFVISIAETLYRGNRAHIVPREYRLLVIVRAVVLVSSTVGNFVALMYLPLTITSAILFSAPIFVCFFAAQFLGERVGPWRWTSIVIGFIGVLVVIQPFDGDMEWAALLSVINAIFMALYSILTRKLAGKVSAGSMQFYSGAIGTIALAPLAYIVWMPTDDSFVLFLWVALGLLGWTGHELMTRAHSFAPASVLMPFSYSFLLYLAVFSFIVFAHLPSTTTLIGSAIIIFSGLVIWQRERIIARRTQKATVDTHG